LDSSKEFHREFPVGDIIGDTYTVLRHIGKGAMGHVYHVRHNLLTTEYALKILNSEETDEIAAERFRLEAQTVAMMQHPNIVGIHNYGLHDHARPYFVMDLLQGMDLGERLKATGPLDVSETAKTFVEVCAGIAYAHGKGVIHRDIKPGNIFLLNLPGPKGEKLKVVDFGVVKLTHCQHIQSLTGVGLAVGSPHFMSPEQCMGQPVDARSDVYSLGCSLFYTLTGTFPFRGRNVTEIMLLHTEAPAPTLSKATGRKFPQAVENIISIALAKAASERYQTVEQLSEELQRLIPPDQTVTVSPALTMDMSVGQAARVACDFPEAMATMRVPSTAQVSKKRILPLALAGVALVCTVAISIILQLRQQQRYPQQPVKAPTAVALAAKGQQLPDQNGAHPPLVKSGQVNKAESKADDKEHQYPTNQIVTASLMIQKRFSTMLREGNIEYRVFNFPKDVALGLIASSGGGPAVRATGLIKYPADELITMIPADVVERYPKCLKRFKAGDLYCLKFLNDHDSDELIEATTGIPDVRMLDFENCWDMTTNCLGSLNKFDKLTAFRCPYSKFDGAILPKAKCWDKLEALDLADFEQVAPMLQALKGFKALRKLTIKCTYLTDNNFKVIASLSKLQYLNLDGTYVTPNNLNTLSAMPELETLDLANSGINSSSSGIFKQFPRLKSLYIKSAKLKPGQYEKLKASLPGLSVY
jgi:tRNA A-37 threonylcarbamoyl transferase component Bud32